MRSLATRAPKEPPLGPTEDYYDPRLMPLVTVGEDLPPRHPKSEDPALRRETVAAMIFGQRSRRLGTAAINAVRAVGSYFESQPPGRHRAPKSQQVPAEPGGVAFRTGRVAMGIPPAESVGRQSALVGPTLRELHTVRTHQSAEPVPAGPSAALTAPTLHDVPHPDSWSRLPTEPHSQIPTNV